MLAACFFVLPVMGLAQSNLVFEGSGQRLEAQSSEMEPVFMHGRPSVQFRLSPTTSEAFRTLTGQMIGKTLTVSLCDIQLLEAVVQEQLDGVGILDFPTAQAAIVVADVVNGDAGCDALEAHFDD